MKFRKKQFKLEITVKIAERSAYLDKIPDISFSVREHVPIGVHPVDYLRQRLTEEINRHSSQTAIQTKEPITTSGDI